MTLFCGCNNKEIVRTEFVKCQIPAQLLEAEIYTHPKVNNDKEIIEAYVNLWYFYKDLKTKLNAIKEYVDDNKTN